VKRSVCGECVERSVREQWKRCVKQGDGAANAGSERAPLQAGDKSERRNCWRVWFEMMLCGTEAVRMGGGAAWRMRSPVILPPQ
jgi:hypothetical protein